MGHHSLFCLIGTTCLEMYKQILLIFALAMAAAFASELGYKGYNDYGYNHGYDSHRLHRRSPTVFLPPFIATKGLLALAKVPFPIGKQERGVDVCQSHRCLFVCIARV